jgi:hypothetical protein
MKLNALAMIALFGGLAFASSPCAQPVQKEARPRRLRGPKPSSSISRMAP